MTYKQALELKEAGFPQGGRGSWYEDKDNIYHNMGIVAPPSEKWVYIPTLEEVIEACGDRFRGITKHYGQIGATNHTTPWYSAQSVEMKPAQVGETGLTPLEAVSKLYIELKK